MRDLTKQEREFFTKLLKRSPTKHQGYWRYRISIDRINRSYKRARVILQLRLGKKLEVWELVHHKDRNKENDAIGNLELLNASEHADNHHDASRAKPANWKPANTLNQDIVDRILELSKGMVLVNCSEISRQLEKEGIKVCSVTIKRYLPKGI